jgi:hypothetical protein
LLEQREPIREERRDARETRRDERQEALGDRDLGSVRDAVRAAVREALVEERERR